MWKYVKLVLSRGAPLWNATVARVHNLVYAAKVAQQVEAFFGGKACYNGKSLKYKILLRAARSESAIGSDLVKHLQERPIPTGLSFKIIPELSTYTPDT